MVSMRAALLRGACMRKMIWLIVPLFALASCYSVPDRADSTFDIQRSYKEVADCMWLTFRKEGGWTRTDLDSLNKIEFAFGNSVSTAGRIDIIGLGDNRTRISSHMPATIWGAGVWAKRYKPIYDACS